MTRVSTDAPLCPARESVAPPQQPILRTTALCKQYAGRRGVVSAFESIDLSVAAGEVVCLLGPSGCGKSSLLATLAGLQPPSSGTVWFDDEPMRRPDPRIAVLFQDPSLLPWLDLRQNVGFGLRLRSGPRLRADEAAQRVTQVIHRVGLAGFEHAYPSQLSGGMAQRVALARALARRPALLLMDEPFGALDAMTRIEMQQLLLNAVAEQLTTVLLVTHDIDEALTLGDRVILMSRRPGRLHREWQIRSTRGAGEIPRAATREQILAELSSVVSSTLSPADELTSKVFQ